MFLYFFFQVIGCSTSSVSSTYPPCKEIQIPEFETCLLVESSIMGLIIIIRPMMLESRIMGLGVRNHGPWDRESR